MEPLDYASGDRRIVEKPQPRREQRNAPVYEPSPLWDLGEWVVYIVLEILGSLF